VSFASGSTRLAGTLLIPQGKGPHPALVLLHGSGPQDRNGTLPFARFLVRHGIAILASDKRGVGASQGDWRKASFEALAEDALAGVAFLRSRRDMDRKRVGLFGVSQGGWIGPLAASRSRNVALVVSVSGPGVTPAEQTLDLIEAELRNEGLPEAEVQEALDLTKLAFHYGRTGTGWDEYAAALARSRERSWLPYLPLPPDAQDDGWEQQRLFYNYDPAPALAALRCPVLALFGEKDSGVPVEKNRGRWLAALTRGGHRKHDLIVVPAANHLMFEAKSGSLFEIPGLDRFAPGYRRILLDWLRDRFSLPSAAVEPSAESLRRTGSDR
jgi:pimeloyl-ACP methyl ester carboxylesterase